MHFILPKLPRRCTIGLLSAHPGPHWGGLFYERRLATYTERMPVLDMNRLQIQQTELAIILIDRIASVDRRLAGTRSPKITAKLDSERRFLRRIQMESKVA